jgi:hypothetical protein
MHARTHAGKAKTLFRRQMLKLDSAPLPGGIQSHAPPEKLVPGHLHHLQYLAI